MFGELRTTFYGDMWDVKIAHNSRNIAYTDLDLGLRMDLLLLPTPTAIPDPALSCGTVSLHPADFDRLGEYACSVPLHQRRTPSSTTNTRPSNSRDTRPLMPRHPPSCPSSISTTRLHSKHPSRLPTPSSFYTALGKFSALLDDPANRLEYTLREGDAVLFDNRRVLHARTAFTDAGDTGEGQADGTNRWLKGCYLEADAILDRGRILSAKLERKKLHVHLTI
ncbi:hypothetical protein BU15DRAFT_75480 [Melanogaster broomeanus]|nr:hypothetical protein BU15DRAFT_75480 [Melanogaster broomeanus]